MHKFLVFIFFIISLPPVGQAQEINFGEYGSYNLTVGERNNDDLSFGQVITGSGPYTIGINNAKVVKITGVEYLDVTVEVTAPSSLYLNGNPATSGNSQKTIPFTLKAAYANNKGKPNVGQSKFITNINNNSFIKQFPILERQHQPPGPPPKPPTDAFDQSKVEDTAYLYLYGSIDVGEVDAGSYSGQITVTINYD